MVISANWETFLNNLNFKSKKNINIGNEINIKDYMCFVAVIKNRVLSSVHPGLAVFFVKLKKSNGFLNQ